MLFEMQKKQNKTKQKTKQNKTTTTTTTKQHNTKTNLTKGPSVFIRRGGWWFSEGPPERKWHIEGGHSP